MNTMDLLPAIIALGSMGGLLYLGIRNLQKKPIAPRSALLAA